MIKLYIFLGFIIFVILFYYFGTMFNDKFILKKRSEEDSQLLQALLCLLEKNKNNIMYTGGYIQFMSKPSIVMDYHYMSYDYYFVRPSLKIFTTKEQKYINKIVKDSINIKKSKDEKIKEDNKKIMNSTFLNNISVNSGCKPGDFK